MIGEWLTLLEATALARALRDSVLAYPLVNAAHVAGIALLVGSIVPLDLRLLGLWRSVPLAPLWHVLTRTAAGGLTLAVVSGSLLFITRAPEYAESSLFICKMMTLVVGTANALALRVMGAPEVLRMQPTIARPVRRVQLAGGVSLAAWLTTLTLGRLVGYF